MSRLVFLAFSSRRAMGLPVAPALVSQLCLPSSRIQGAGDWRVTASVPRLQGSGVRDFPGGHQEDRVCFHPLPTRAGVVGSCGGQTPKLGALELSATWPSWDCHAGGRDDPHGPGLALGPTRGEGEPRAILPSPGQWWSEKSNGKGHGVKGAGERPGGQRRRWGPLSACPSERGQAPAAPGHEPPAPTPPGPLASGGPPPDCRLGSLWPAVKLAPTSRGQRRLGAPRHVGPHPAICCSKAGPAPPFAGPRRR